MTNNIKSAAQAKKKSHVLKNISTNHFLSSKRLCGWTVITMFTKACLLSSSVCRCQCILSSNYSCTLQGQRVRIDTRFLVYILLVLYTSICTLPKGSSKVIMSLSQARGWDKITVSVYYCSNIFSQTRGWDEVTIIVYIYRWIFSQTRGWDAYEVTCNYFPLNFHPSEGWDEVTVHNYLPLNFQPS